MKKTNKSETKKGTIPKYDIMSYYTVGEITVDENGENPMICIRDGGALPEDWEVYKPESEDAKDG